MFKVIDLSNIKNEHICCALSEKKGEKTTSLKKQWLKNQFENGLVFRKLDVRGKVFIEYLPAEYAFAPIKAPNYLYINCLWVSGQYKGKGYAQKLLDSCINDAKAQDKSGVVVLSSKKKRHFMSDPSHLKHYGFKVADECVPDFELLYLSFDDADKPRFNIGTNREDNILYYSHQCPHTEKYGQIIQDVARKYDINLILKRYHTYQEAQLSPSPFTTYALYLNGQFVTTEILTEKKFIKILEKYLLIEKDD